MSELTLLTTQIRNDQALVRRLMITSWLTYCLSDLIVPQHLSYKAELKLYLNMVLLLPLLTDSVAPMSTAAVSPTYSFYGSNRDHAIVVEADSALNSGQSSCLPWCWCICCTSTTLRIRVNWRNTMNLPSIRLSTGAVHPVCCSLHAPMLSNCSKMDKVLSSITCSPYVEISFGP